MEQSSAKQGASPRWAVMLIIIGTLIAIGSGIGLVRLAPTPAPTTVAETQTPTISRPQTTPTEVDQPLVARQIVQPPTLEVLPTSTTTPTSTRTAPATATRTPSPSTEVAQEQPTAEGTPIAFTTEEKNALSWMCYYEVGGMGTVKYDACLSVISTVRARFVLASGFGTDVLSVLRRPNQFNIPIVTDNPHDTFLPTVEQYANGARGSCNAYLYFDSVSGGQSLCIIYGFNSFIEFHNG